MESEEDNIDKNKTIYYQKENRDLNPSLSLQLRQNIYP